MRSPMGVPPGSRTRTTARPSSSRAAASIAAWVVLPQPSRPSKEKNTGSGYRAAQQLPEALNASARRPVDRYGSEMMRDEQVLVGRKPSCLRPGAAASACWLAGARPGEWFPPPVANTLTRERADPRAQAAHRCDRIGANPRE